MADDERDERRHNGRPGEPIECGAATPYPSPHPGAMPPAGRDTTAEAAHADNFVEQTAQRMVW